MNAKVVYLIQFRKDYVELFFERQSGAFDYVDMFSGEDALTKAENMAFSLIEETPRIDLSFQNCFGKLLIYQADLTHPNISCLGHSLAPEENILAFLDSYPSFGKANDIWAELYDFAKKSINQTDIAAYLNGLARQSAILEGEFFFLDADPLKLSICVMRE